MALISRKATDTHTKILESAVHAFSKKGFADATVKQIADDAGFNTLTVFRHFKDKENLFRSVIDHFYNFDFGTQHIDELIHFSDLEEDLTILAGEYFRMIFQNLDIVRVFIGEVALIQKLQMPSWYAPVKLKQHFSSFLLRYSAQRTLQLTSMDKITEFFICHVTRRSLEYNTHDNIVSYTEELKEDFLKRNKAELTFLYEMIDVS